MKLKSNHTRIYLYLFFILLPLGLKAEHKNKLQTREIKAKIDSGYVIAEILLKDIEVKTDTGVLYFWYYNGSIKQNKGGYYGALLHGKFLVFTNDDVLIEKGQFYEGVKVNTWKTWYQNSNLKIVSNYKEGFLDGNYIEYDPNCRIIKKLNYKKNLLDGKCLTYQNNYAINAKYRNGKLINVKDNEDEKIEKKKENRRKKKTVVKDNKDKKRKKTEEGNTKKKPEKKVKKEITEKKEKNKKKEKKTFKVITLFKKKADKNK